MYKENQQEKSLEEKRLIEIKPISFERPINGKSLNQMDKKHSLTQQIKRSEQKLAKLEKEKKNLIQETKKAIKQEKELWEKEKKKWIEQAKNEGYEKGMSLGKKKGNDKYQSLIQKINQLQEDLTIKYYEKLESSKKDILLLAINTAERIIEKQIDHDKKSFLPIVSSAIKEVKNQPTISLYLHPYNFEEVYSQKETLEKVINGEAHLSLYIDENLNKNDCIIEHPLGRIDASVNTQLTKIHEALDEYLEQSKNDSK